MISILAMGDWSETQVTTSQVNSSRATAPAVDALIDRAWTEARNHLGAVNLFDGPMCRLESWRASDESLHLDLSATSYRIFFGTHLSGNAGELDPKFRANAIGASAALVSSDGFLLLGRRNNSVAYYPRRIHPFAGTLEPRESAKPFDAIRRELREELLLSADAIDDVRCIGLVEDESIRQPELVFLVRSNRTKQQVESQLDPAEHSGLWSCRIEDPIVADDHFTPVAAATIELCRTRFSRPS